MLQRIDLYKVEKSVFFKISDIVITVINHQVIGGIQVWT